MKNTVWSSLSAASVMGAALYATAVWMPQPSGTTAVSATFAAPQKGATKSVASDDVRPESDPVIFNNMKTAAGPLPKGPNYDLEEVLSGEREVPRVTWAALPKNLSAVRETNERKAIFFKTVLPLVLQVNEQITVERGRLWELKSQQLSGKKLDALDRLWLAVLSEQYGTRRGDIVAILERHDVVPPSLALAQAATESAWGTSRFVREGNAMFGEWTFKADDKGIVPAGRDTGKTHRVRAFDTLQDSVRSYVTNLNKHRAYKEFRSQRSEMLAQGRVVDGMELAGTLHRYSERGAAYVAEIRAIISTNDLDLLDNAVLASNGSLEPII